MVTPSSMAISKSKKCCWCDKLVYGPVLVHSLTAATIHRHCGAQIGVHALAQRDDGQTETPPVFHHIDRPSIDWDVKPMHVDAYLQLDLFDRGGG